jgi:hypothetical protein
VRHTDSRLLREARARLIFSRISAGAPRAFYESRFLSKDPVLTLARPGGDGTKSWAGSGSFLGPSSLQQGAANEALRENALEVFISFIRQALASDSLSDVESRVLICVLFV